MKAQVLILFLLITAKPLFSQIVEYPRVKHAAQHSTLITRIERTAKYTIVSFEHTNTTGGWINLSPSIYLQDYEGDALFKFVKAEGIPLSPKKLQIKAEEKVTFRVFFAKIPESVKTVNIIERAVPAQEQVNYFNFFGVSLTVSAKTTEGAGVEI